MAAAPETSAPSSPPLRDERQGKLNRPDAVMLTMRPVTAEGWPIIDQAAGSRLGPARGLFLGVAIGTVMWAVIGLMVWRFLR